MNMHIKLIDNLIVRTAQSTEDTYIVYNTCNYKCIYLDFVSFNIYSFIIGRASTHIKDIETFIRDNNYKIDTNELKEFILFLNQLNFFEVVYEE